MDDTDPYLNSVTNEQIPVPEQEVLSFIYHPEFHNISSSTYPGFRPIGRLDAGWHQRGRWNFPGPIYTAESDTCGTGLMGAPHNVIFDEWHEEFVMIQPRTAIELRQVEVAAETEAFGAYRCDGNAHWTPALVREWWANLPGLVAELNAPEVAAANFKQETRYLAYLLSYAAKDLRRYIYFLDHGAYPMDKAILLPDL